MRRREECELGVGEIRVITMVPHCLFLPAVYAGSNNTPVTNCGDDRGSRRA
jgi:hypothetical protein